MTMNDRLDGSSIKRIDIGGGGQIASSPPIETSLDFNLMDRCQMLEGVEVFP